MTAAARPSSPRAQTVTLQPSPSSALTVAKPRPRVEPVTIAILSLIPRSIQPVPPFLPVLPLDALVEETPKRVVERSGLLHVGHGARAGDHDEFRAGDVLVHLLAQGRRRDRVFGADDDLHGNAYGRKHRRRIRPGHQSRQ